MHHLIQEGIIKSIITQANPSETLKGDMVFQTNSGDSVSTTMVIKDSGNVGIGTTSFAHAVMELIGYIRSGNTVGADNTAKYIYSGNFKAIVHYTNSEHATT